jgi:hypothetical protein
MVGGESWEQFWYAHKPPSHEYALPILFSIEPSLGLDPLLPSLVKPSHDQLGSIPTLPTRVTRGLISNSWGTVKNASSVLVKQPVKQIPCLVSQTPPCGSQAQGFGIRTTKQK